MPYDDAARALFQVPHGEFVAERKRLAAELKAAGDKLAASRISRLQRPPITAWAVNQLYWHARDAVDTLFALATRLRDGDLSATTAHRDALAKLRNRAAAMLSDAGHGANEATLRRIALTLSALAAAGTWMPDGEGMLSADRDPPGFEAVGVINEPAAPLPPKAEPVKYDFDAPVTPVTVEPTPPPAPSAPKRNAIAELAAKRKEMQEEEKKRRAAERRGEVYVPETPAPSAAPPPAVTTSADDEAGTDDTDDTPIAQAPRARTLSLVPPLPTAAEDDAEEDAEDAGADEDDDDLDRAVPSEESDESDDDESDDNADEVEAPASAAPKMSALEQLRARKKQQAEEAEEERRRRFMEDGGTRDKVIAKRMMEAQERNRETADTKRERVEAAVRAKVEAQRATDTAKRVTSSDPDLDEDGEVDEDADEATPALTVEPGGRPPSAAKGPPQPSDLINALAAKLGAKPPAIPTSTPASASARPSTPAASANLSTGASPARTGGESARAPAKLSTGASPARAGHESAATPSTGASPARTGDEAPRAPAKLSTGASPARHVPETTHPPGTFPRPRTPSPSSLGTSTPASAGRPAPLSDAERRKIDARAKLRAELETRLRTASADVLAAEQRVEQLTAALSEADDALEAARAIVEDLQEKLDALD